MKVVAAELLKLAKEMTKAEMTFLRSPDIEDGKMSVIQYEISRLVDTIRRNERLEKTFVHRTDDDKAMVLEVGIADHEAVGAIVREIKELARKLAVKNDIKMEKG